MRDTTRHQDHDRGDLLQLRQQLIDTREQLIEARARNVRLRGALVEVVGLQGFEPGPEDYARWREVLAETVAKTVANA